MGAPGMARCAQAQPGEPTEFGKFCTLSPSEKVLRRKRHALHYIYGKDMRLRCWSRREYRELDISEFAIIKAEQKYVIGVLSGGVEWFLPHKTSVEGVELAAPQFIRASRSVLVAPSHVLGISGRSKKRILHTTVGDYRLSRLVRLEVIMAAAQSNALCL